MPRPGREGSRPGPRWGRAFIRLSVGLLALLASVSQAEARSLAPASPATPPAVILPSPPPLPPTPTLAPSAPPGRPSGPEPASPPPVSVTSPRPQPEPSLAVVIPGPGINRPDWQDLGPPEAGAPPPSRPSGLPHYVGLPRAAREAAERLRDLSALLRAHLGARRLASARVTLMRAEDLVARAEREHLVLKIHPDWSEPRVELIDLRARYEALRRGPLDDESRRLAEQAAARLAPQFSRAGQGLAALTPPQLEARLLDLRQALAAAEADPYLRENPAWRVARQPLQRDMERLENLLAVRQGQGSLAMALLRIDQLRASADARLAAQDFTGAVGDLEALEEACFTFAHDLADMRAHGFDQTQLSWHGPDGDWRGQAVLARVERWRQEARRRLALLGPPSSPPPTPASRPPRR
ncbi:MAG: hypothetical protein VKP62_10660 [Candidatus Sericytochromatia bacterium]|nr:hypothetical protein [Candidatus Sericytochromatia bacterium]